MTPQRPVFDVLIGRDRGAWRLYFAAHSWMPPSLARRSDRHLQIFPVGRPDAAVLDAFMWAADAPFEKRVLADGGMEIRAAGRSAVVLHEWLAELVGAPR